MKNMRSLMMAAVCAAALSGCTTDSGKPGFLTNMFCGMRESACTQRCEAMEPREALACRRTCEDSGRDKCS